MKKSLISFMMLALLTVTVSVGDLSLNLGVCDDTEHIGERG